MIANLAVSPANLKKGMNFFRTLLYRHNCSAHMICRPGYRAAS
jgi:hypothetical protein